MPKSSLLCFLLGKSGVTCNLHLQQKSVKREILHVIPYVVSRDLSQVGDLRTTILQLFSHASEEVKTAAAYSLGSVAVGNLEAFLPALLHEMKAQPKKQYLLLHALKEVLKRNYEAYQKK